MCKSEVNQYHWQSGGTDLFHLFEYHCQCHINHLCWFQSQPAIMATQSLICWSWCNENKDGTPVKYAFLLSFGSWWSSAKWTWLLPRRYKKRWKNIWIMCWIPCCDHVEFTVTELTLTMLRLLSSKAQKHNFLWKPSKPCHAGIHWKALTEYSQMSTHLTGFQSFFSFFASFCIGKISHQQHNC